MRVLVRSNNIEDCRRRMKMKERKGWKAITDIKMDNSTEDLSWVCVMERPDEPGKEGKKHRWNRQLPIWYED